MIEQGPIPIGNLHLLTHIVSLLPPFANRLLILLIFMFILFSSLELFFLFLRHDLPSLRQTPVPHADGTHARPFASDRYSA